VRRYRARANATRAEINGKDPLRASPTAEQEVEVSTPDEPDAPHETTAGP
jgi:hypothetical protein